MNAKIVALVVLVLAVLALGYKAILGVQADDKSKQKIDKAADERGFIVKVGDVAPLFSATIANGDTVFHLANNKGKVVMIQFTASWCSVCRKEMPFIEKEIHQKYINNKDFVLLALDYDEALQKINELIEATGITYPVGFDKGASIFHRYAAQKAGVTRNIIIGKDGKIVFLTRLFNRNEFNEMKAAIQKALDAY